MAPRISTIPQGGKLWVNTTSPWAANNANADMFCAAIRSRHDQSGFSERASGANQFPAKSDPQPHARRDLVMIAALLFHPDIGSILFDTGSCEDVAASWGDEAMELGPIIRDKATQGLAEAIKATGAGTIEDVRVVVLSHLHCDHAGGLEHFFGKDTEIWCHEEELKHAFWSYATGFGRGPYVKDYLDVEKLNWNTFSGSTFELYQGVTLHHVPGHTIGGVALELSLEKEGCVVITGDAFHIHENYEHGIHPGTLTTDLNAWHRSRTYIRALVQRKQDKVVLGHDPDYFMASKASPEYTQ